jgi:hypothetical protein
VSDYPDWTDLVHIIGTDIMVAVDVQGAYIMMPVDIQGQYITLDIDIVAQSVGSIAIDIAAQSVGSLNVNLAASVVTMDVNIKSITGGVTFNIGSVSGTVTVSVTGTAQIDIETQSVAIKNQAEWSAQAGEDKNFYEAYSEETTGYISYTVTVGKTLYITQIGFAITGHDSADKDSNQMGWVAIYNATTETTKLEFGGNGGRIASLIRPIAIPAGQEVRFYWYSGANHAVDGSISVGGYEV